MSRPPDGLPRFTPAERRVHQATALLVLVLTLTAAVLYVQPLALAVGRRPLVEGLHVAAGFLLPAPTLLGLLSPEFRADVARLNRFVPGDREWLLRRDRRTAGLPVGKFNAGQKLAAAVVAGAGLLLLATGLLMLVGVRLAVPVGWRRGATAVHDLTSAGLLVLLAGHFWQAWRHPEARAALRTGQVDPEYAAREHARWYAEQS